jgi:TRAP-type transport system periplasmic protein
MLPTETGEIDLGWSIAGMRVIFSLKDRSSLKDIQSPKLRINPTSEQA